VSRALRSRPSSFNIQFVAKPALDYRKLSIAERLQLVEDIWDSIAEETHGLPLPAEVLDDAERRLAEHRADPASAIPWEEIRAELYKRGG
jgi:putative addiction module component (TIGR02574 family)